MGYIRHRFKYKPGQTVKFKIWGGDRFIGEVTSYWLVNGSKLVYWVYCKNTGRGYTTLEKNMEAA